MPAASDRAERSDTLVMSPTEQAQDGAEANQLDRPRPSTMLRLRRRIGSDAFALGSCCVLVLVVTVTVLAPVLAPHDPNVVDNTLRLAGPSSDHFFGTDDLGRDIFSRLIWGGRVSLVTAAVPALAALVVGSVLGLLAGYLGGWIDATIMRVMDTLMSFPYILLALGIAAALGPGLFNAMLAVTVVTIPVFARLIRAAVLSIKESEFILAARGLGAGGWSTVGRHVVPNTLSILVVYGTLQTGRMVIAAASLSFLGLGVQPPTADWGSMLADGQDSLRIAPHVSAFPGLMIFTVTLALNILGEAFRDALDPRYAGDLNTRTAS